MYIILFYIFFSAPIDDSSLFSIRLTLTNINSRFRKSENKDISLQSRNRIKMVSRGGVEKLVA